MSLTARILSGFVALALAGYFFLFEPVLDRVERQYLEAAEEPMVDTAELLAGIVSAQLAAAGRLSDSLAAGLKQASERRLSTIIYGIRKQQVLMDVYVTDRRGIVLYDSGHPSRIGADFSRFNDVQRTLRGEYGARSSRENEADDRSSIMYVGAPIVVRGETVGVLSVYKPQRAMRGFIDETRRQLTALALVAIGVFLAFGFLLSRWVTEPLARLTRHAEAVTRGERAAPPRMPGRHLRVLGDSVEQMRHALEDRNYVASYVQTLSHEMKTPVAAIRGAAELLEEELPPDRREQFLRNIRGEAARLQNLIEQLLALSSLENRQSLDNPQPVDFASVVRRLADEARCRGNRVELSTPPACEVRGDEFLLETAARNLLQNALDFSTGDSPVEMMLTTRSREAVLRVVDSGPGLPDFAVGRVFERFYSLPRPDGGRKSSGLGLCFAREAATLHGGSVTLRNRADSPGAEAILTLPLS